MREEKLLPCPSCGSDRAELTENSAQTMTYVWCPNCRMQGPAYFNGNLERVAAIAAWNALPRALRWTKEPPTTPGWYWHHMPPAFGTVIEYVDTETWERTPSAEWAGPIPEPK